MPATPNTATPSGTDTPASTISFQSVEFSLHLVLRLRLLLVLLLDLLMLLLPRHLVFMFLLAEEDATFRNVSPNIWAQTKSGDICLNRDCSVPASTTDVLDGWRCPGGYYLYSADYFKPHVGGFSHRSQCQRPTSRRAMEIYLRLFFLAEG